MRHALVVVCAAFAVAGAIPAASAQSALVDLSKPQTGKARFVLNADLTPADLGAAEEKPAPALASASRAAACGDRCRMDQPVVPKPAQESAPRGPAWSPSGNRTSAVVVFNSKAMQDATQAVERRKSAFRLRRR